MSTEKKKVEIKKSEVIRLMDQEKMKREDLAKHFGLSKVQMAKAIKQLGLQKKKVYPASFMVIDDLTDEKAVKEASPAETGEDNF